MRSMKGGETTVYFRGPCHLRFSRYRNGRLAIELCPAGDDEQSLVATVNLRDCVIGEDEVLIKDYSENRGVMDALILAGVIEDTGRSMPEHCPIARVGRLLVKPVVSE